MGSWRGMGVSRVGLWAVGSASGRVAPLVCSLGVGFLWGAVMGCRVFVALMGTMCALFPLLGVSYGLCLYLYSEVLGGYLVELSGFIGLSVCAT